MVVRDHPTLSLSRQCHLLSIGRSSLYYESKGESEEALALMRRIDELFLNRPDVQAFTPILAVQAVPGRDHIDQIGQ